MPSKNRVSLHHLTPNEGWVERDARPSNAVQTLRRTADRSPNGKPQIAYTRDWVHPERSSEDVTKLRDRFPLPEAQVWGLSADISWEL